MDASENIMHSDLLTYDFRRRGLPRIELSLDTSNMPVTQLQIPIPSGGSKAESVGDALVLLQDRWEDDKSTAEALRYLAESRQPDGSIDWFNYWKLQGYRFRHLRMICDELDQLAKAHPFHPVDRESFGKAGITLAKNGVTSLQVLAENLAAGLPEMRGFGKTKSEELFLCLVKYIQNFKQGDPVFRSEEPSVNQDSSSDVASFNTINHEGLARLNEETRNLPLKAIHLEYRSEIFAEAGLVTLGDLVDASKDGIPPIRSVGKGTIKKMKFVLSAISESVDEDGRIDCKLFTRRTNIPMIPAGTVPSSGKEFILLLPAVGEELVSATKDERDRDIFMNRLTRKRSEQETLEELGARAGVSRERIRQIEKILLQRLSDALLYDEYPTLEFRFDPGFSRFFKQAAATFEGGDQDISVERFMLKLKETWETPVEDILPHMALITAILSSKSVKPANLRIDRTVPVSLWENLPKVVSNKSLKELPIGKGIGVFDDSGIETLGEAIGALLDRQIAISDLQKFRKVLKHISNARKECRSDSSFWLCYAKQAGLEILPNKETETPGDFLRDVYDVLLKAISANHGSASSPEVFKLRTSRPLETRYTLSKVSESLGIYAPTVKRNETQFVTALNSQLIERDFTESAVFFRDSFLGYWHQANEVYQSNREDFTRFKFNLERKWEIKAGSLDQYADMIWTVLNIYPNGRNVLRSRGKRSRVEKSEKKILAINGVIKLRGFKRVY